MKQNQTMVYEGDTEFEHYQVIDMDYEHRPARVLFSGNGVVAQSGVARDDQPDLLFDYNQRFLELVGSMYPRRVLVIGGGAFTLPMALIAALPDVEVDVVELDPGLLPLAERYFGLELNDRLRIIHDDGRAFLEHNKKAYDVIIVDAFTHSTVPRSLLTVEAVRLLKKNLTKNGVVGVNIISAYYGGHAQVMRQCYAAYDAVFKHVNVFPALRSLLSFWLPQNFVLVAHKGKLQELRIRYAAMDPLLTTKHEALQDD